MDLKKLKPVLYPLLAALCGYLASYFSTGCTPAQIAKVESAADRETAKALCIKAVAEAFDDRLTSPATVKLDDLLAFKAELEACLKPAALDAADAGAR